MAQNIFYQQAGRRGEADFPKSIVDEQGTLRRFNADSLLAEFDFPADVTSTLPRDDVQVWGVPSGARSYFQKMRPGDVFLLIGQLSKHALEYGQFFYAGRIVHVVERENFALSERIWGDQGFPLIFLLEGRLIDYSWLEFTSDFGFKPGFYLAGQTMRIAPERVHASPYKTVEAFAAALGLGDLPVEPGSVAPEPDRRGFAEGSRTLREHLRLERSTALVGQFKAGLDDFCCAICGFDFEATFGELGRGFIEAHHVEPLGETGASFRHVEDLLPVCSNCHRMLHRRWPALRPDELRAIVKT
ncbi:MAG: HNH endonuclease [Caulobacteraceae bacterium]|nr:HNH endonuclease [Caulobacteraceae bacterium]